MKIYRRFSFILLLIALLPFAGCSQSQDKGQPVDPSTVFDESLAAGRTVQSYRLVMESRITVGDENRDEYFQIEFVAPDRYRKKSKDGISEFIQIENMQYDWERDDGYWVSQEEDSGFEFPPPGPTPEFLMISTPGGPATPIPIDELDWKQKSNQTIDGVECLHFYGTIDMNRAVDRLIEAIGEQENTSGKKDQMPSLERMRDEEHNLEIWIGRDDHLIRQGRSMSRRLVSDYEADGEQWAETSSLIRYYDFNTPITIEAPENAQPWNEPAHPVKTKSNDG